MGHLTVPLRDRVIIIKGRDKPGPYAKSPGLWRAAYRAALLTLMEDFAGPMGGWTVINSCPSM